MNKKVIVRLDTRRSFLEQLEAMDDELHEDFIEKMENAGWHDRDDCVSDGDIEKEIGDEWWTFVNDLHQQAHPGETKDPAGCRQFPCRDIPIYMLKREY